MSIEDKMELTENEQELLKMIQKAQLSPNEAKRVLKNFQQVKPQKYHNVKIVFPKKHVKFFAFGDAHMGHRGYRPDIKKKMMLDAKRQGCEFGVNAGDTIEGMSGREGHIYELTHIGYSAQMNYFAEQFKFGMPVYSIEAQDSHSGWYHNKSNTGVDIGKELMRRSKDYKFLGYDEQDIILSNGLKIRLRHPGGGTAYAISYKMQKYVESISGGDKPHIIIQGHFHKSMQTFYRNIHCFDVGTLEEQSPFMKKKGTPAHLGYWILDVYMHTDKSKGPERVISQFVPFYD